MDQLLSSLPKTRAEAKEIGSLYYFTNKPCKNGHTSKRRVSNKGCCECLEEYHKAWGEKNKESISEQKKNYYEANKESIREKKKIYEKANKESIREKKKAWYEANKESIREQHKNYDLRKRAERLGCSVEELPKRATSDPARYVYFLVVKDQATNEKLFLKVGITNNQTKRLKQHKRHLAAVGLMFDTILVKDFETEEAAREVEAKIKTSFIVYESDTEGFKSECFMYLPQFEQSMKMLLTCSERRQTCRERVLSSS